MDKNSMDKVPDKSKRPRQERKSARYKVMAEGAPVILWMADAQGQSYYFNHHWREFTGAGDDEKLDGKTWYKALHPDDRDAAVARVKAAFASQADIEVVYRLRRHDGEYRWMLDGGSPYHDSNGEFCGYVGASIDITERHEAEEALEESLRELEKANKALYEQSVRDPLTDLFNRRYFFESLDREISRAKRNNYEIGVMMLDIDHFKPFNDEYGHQAGDAVLRKLARFLGRSVRGDDVVSRYGGEEFSIMMPLATESILRQRAEKLCTGCRLLEISYRDKKLPQLTLSIGGAIFPRHGEKADSLLRTADENLYQAKAAGRDQFVLTG